MIALGLALVAGFAAAVLIGSIVALVRQRIVIRLPGWPPRDWRALLALGGSIVGAAVLTVMLAWIVRIFERWMQPGPLANIAYGLLIIIGLVLLALGFAINRRSFSGSIGPVSFRASGGEDEDAPAQAVVTTTKTEVQP